MRSAIDGSATPIISRRTPAGLASGPRKLNAVGIPSSRRGGPAWRIAGWKRGAKQNPMPASATHRATSSGPQSMRTPSASSTSAAPVDDDAARLPCLHTRPPAPATTSADSVDTLMVWARSPPVPTMSTADMPGSSVTRSAAATMASTMPASSSTVSPFMRRATMNPAICAGVAAPSRISAMTARA